MRSRLLSRLLVALLAGSIASVAAANPFASPGDQGVGEGWVVFPAEAVGDGVMLEDGALKFYDPQPGRKIRVCTAERMDVGSRVRVSGRWKREGIETQHAWQGAWLDLALTGADGKRLQAEGWTGNVLVGPGTSDWEDFRFSFVMPEGAVQARLCAELRGATAGTLWFEDLQMGDAAGSSPGNGKNVLFVVVDGLRADKVGVYGQQKPLTPNIDRFAERSWFAERAWAQYTCTTPSFVSTMLSQYARTHGYIWDAPVTTKDAEVLDTTVPTLAQVLQDNGYVTAGVTTNGRIRPEIGVTRGFEQWVLPGQDQQAVRRALEDLAAWPSDDAPNFFYVHLMTTHVGLFPSPEAQAAVGVSVDVPAKGVTYWGSAPVEDRAKSKKAHDELFQDAYLAAVYDTDRFFQQILDGLEATGLAEDTAVVFASNYGELIGEHGEMGHGNFVYEPLTAVPLVMYLPGTGSGRIGDRVAQLIDIGPTLLEYLELPVPSAWQGGSLLKPAIRPVAASERLGLMAITTDGRWKVIAHQDGSGRPEGYDLQADPGEESPILEGAGPELQAVLDQADAWRQAVPAGQASGE
jgi:arylsulfatase A-like enzyme